MEHDQTNDPHYQKGFNEGYVVTKHMPELADDLSGLKSEAPRMEGFRNGRKQYILEQVREHRAEWQKEGDNKTPLSDKSKDRDKDKDLDR